MSINLGVLVSYGYFGSSMKGWLPFFWGTPSFWRKSGVFFETPRPEVNENGMKR